MVNERYARQVRLLVDVLHLVAAEEDFALKGGTAINLFYRDLPRLSVDIDLTYLPIRDRESSLAEIDEAMARLATAGDTTGIRAARISGGGGSATRVLFQRRSTRVKAEASPVSRGVVFEPQRLRVRPAVEDEFGFAECMVVSFEDLYAGKLHAALDRQHPRDLFDVMLLLENEGLTPRLFSAFLVYVASSNRPPHELLAPNEKALDLEYEREFVGMSSRTVTVEELEATRRRLIHEIQARLTGSPARFLRSLVQGVPDFQLLDLPMADRLPAVLWKVKNIREFKARNPTKHSEQVRALEALLSD